MPHLPKDESLSAQGPLQYTKCASLNPHINVWRNNIKAFSKFVLALSSCLPLDVAGSLDVLSMLLHQAFEKLEEAMCIILILATPDFKKTCIVECDDLGQGIGAVLIQNGRPLAFESHQLKGRDLLKLIYVKEMLAILQCS
jgi:hypothetical protein